MSNHTPADPIMYEILKTQHSGLGLFARQNIPAGTLIIEEIPLIAIPHGNGMSDLVLLAFWELASGDRADAATYMDLCRRNMSTEMEGTDKASSVTVSSSGSEMPDLDDDEDSSEHSSWSEDDVEDAADEAAIREDRVRRFVASFAHLGISRHRGLGAKRCVPSSVIPTQGGQDGEAEENENDHDHSPGGNLPHNKKSESGHSTRVHERSDSGVGEDSSQADDPQIYQAADILNIFETNNLAIEVPSNESSSADPTIYAAICPLAARLNHSCIPNVFCAFNAVTGLHTVHTVRNIAKGEQLFTSYIAGAFMTRSQRRAELLKWDFECECPACSNPRVHEKRRVRLRVLQQAANEAKSDLREGRFSREQAQQTVSILEEMVDLMEAEGLLNPDLADLCGAAGICNLQIGRLEEAVSWFEKKIGLLLCCYGCDNPVYLRENATFQALLDKISAA